MESKIAIDVDTSGQPQIRIDYRLTEDLRDKLIGRFLNWMGLPSSKGFWAYVRLGHEFKSKPDGSFDGAVVYLEPLDRTTLGMHMPEIRCALEGEDIDAPRNSEAPPEVKFAILNHVGGDPRYYRGDGKWTTDWTQIPAEFRFSYKTAELICDFMSKDDHTAYAFGKIPETLGEELNSRLRKG